MPTSNSWTSRLRRLRLGATPLLLLLAGCSGADFPSGRPRGELQRALEEAHLLRFEGKLPEAHAGYVTACRTDGTLFEAWDLALRTAPDESARARLAAELERLIPALAPSESVAAQAILLSLEPDLAAREEALYPLIQGDGPETGWPRSALGDLLSERGSSRAAAEEYARAAEANPWIANAWLGLARCRTELSEWSAAQDAYERYVKLRPTDPTALYNLAWLLLEKERRARDAQVLLEQALRVSPRDVRLLLALGKAALVRGGPADIEVAEDAYRQASELAPTEPLVHWNLGVLAADHLNDARRAIRHFRRYLELGGEDRQRVERWIRELEEARTPNS